MEITKKYVDDLSYNIIGAAIEVHKYIGPGLPESVYHKCMLKELRERNLQIISQLSTLINYNALVGILKNFNCTNIFSEKDKKHL